jgi:hypothetical protein
MRLSLRFGIEVVVQSLYANESSLFLSPGEKYGLAGVTLKLPLTADEEHITRWLAAARAVSC